MTLKIRTLRCLVLLVAFWVLGAAAAAAQDLRILRHSKDRPMNNLLLAMLERSGVHTDEFGDATGSLPLEPLSGV